MNDTPNEQPAVGRDEPKCTCPDFDSFGHEPGCPWLAWRAAAANHGARETNAEAFASSDWLGSVPGGGSKARRC